MENKEDIMRAGLEEDIPEKMIDDEADSYESHH